MGYTLSETSSTKQNLMSGFAAHLVDDFLSLQVYQWIIHKYFVLQPEACMFLVHTAHKQTKMD